MKKNISFTILSCLVCATLLIGCNMSNSTPSSSKWDINQYLKKIWIVDDESETKYEHPFSFFITSIEGKRITGRIQIGQTALPDLFVNRKESSLYLGFFSGELQDDTAICKFSIGSDITGELNIFIDENNNLEASIIFSEKSKDEHNISGLVYQFRPYNLTSDIEFNSEKEKSTLVDLDSWGQVYVVSELVGRNPIAFITDLEDNILYQFWPSIIGTQISDIYIEDLNGDGLMDISFLLVPLDIGISDADITFEYIQGQDGLFSSKDLLQQ